MRNLLIIFFIISGFDLAVFLLTIRNDEISIIFSISLRPFSFKVLPVETRSTILLVNPSIGAISSDPLSFKHSA